MVAAISGLLLLAAGFSGVPSRFWGRIDQCLAPIQFQRMAGNLKRRRDLGILSRPG